MSRAGWCVQRAAFPRLPWHGPPGRSGGVNTNPTEIWRNPRAVIRQARAGAGLNAQDLAAVGITNQRCTTVVWDRGGTPLHNAVVWQDTRTATHVAEMARNG